MTLPPKADHRNLMEVGSAALPSLDSPTSRAAPPIDFRPSGTLLIAHIVAQELRKQDPCRRFSPSTNRFIDNPKAVSMVDPKLRRGFHSLHP